MSAFIGASSEYAGGVPSAATATDPAKYQPLGDSKRDRPLGRKTYSPSNWRM
jgi:hypothetical protein